MKTSISQSFIAPTTNSCSYSTIPKHPDLSRFYLFTLFSHSRSNPSKHPTTATLPWAHALSSRYTCIRNMSRSDTQTTEIWGEVVLVFDFWIAVETKSTLRPRTIFARNSIVSLLNIAPRDEFVMYITSLLFYGRQIAGRNDRWKGTVKRYYGRHRMVKQ